MMPDRRRLVLILLIVLLLMPVTLMAKRPSKRQHTVEGDSIRISLDEVVFKPKKQKYSKKNNPAVDFVNRLRKLSDNIDPRRNPNYSYRLRENITMGLGNFVASPDSNVFLRRFSFLKEYIDTSSVTGQPFLPLITRDKASTVYTRANPESEKEYVEARANSGVEDFVDPENMRIIYEDVLREIDLYQNDVVIFRNHFVSPLSKIGPDFYKYWLTDTVDIDGEPHVELSFVPRNNMSFGFTGKIYVGAADSTMMIRRVIMNVPKAINLNFIDRVFITQEYTRAADGSRLKLVDDLTALMELLPNMPEVYARRITTYSGHNFDLRPDSIFETPNREVILDLPEKSELLADRSEYNQNVSTMMTRLRATPLYYWTDRALRILFNGYVSTGKNSKFDIGPVSTFLSHNSLEGWRLRFGGMTTANLSPRFFARGYGAYGIKDHKWKYSGEVEYSFIDKKYHSREFPVKSVRLLHTYDVDMLGQDMGENSDDIFTAFKRSEDHQIIYHRLSKFEFNYELPFNLSITASAETDRRYANRWMTFEYGDGTMLRYYDRTAFTIGLRFSPGEKYFQTRSGRRRINADAPVIQLSHTFAPNGDFGNRFTLNRTDISLSHRFWFSAFGYADVSVNASHIWSRSPYPDLILAPANLSYVMNGSSFSLLNPLEFINDSYGSWNTSYYARGAIFNAIPLLRRAGWREVFTFRGFFGKLNKRNNPAENPGLFRFPEISHTERMHPGTPYMEAGIGIENIFRVLRIDYVWRLTYRNRQDIDKSGLRVSFHLSF